MGKRKSEDGLYWEAIRKVERDMITWAMENKITVPAAAALLGINVAYLYMRAKQLGVQITTRTFKKKSKPRRAQARRSSSGRERTSTISKEPITTGLVAPAAGATEGGES